VLLLGSSSDALQRLISIELMANVTSLPQSANAYQSESVPNPLDSISPNKIFEDQSQFPSMINQLIHMPASRIPWGHSLRISQSCGLLFIRPFHSCPRRIFAVMLLACPYLGTAIKKAMIHLIVTYQQDGYFKLGFSQLLTLLYPTLYALFLRNIGPEANNILSTSVQVYTANTVLVCMSSDGIQSRIFTEGTTKS
jgi:hypothetical protein